MDISNDLLSLRRSPLGLRGLKLESFLDALVVCMSQPTRAAWIEIRFLCRLATPIVVAAHSGCVD